RAVDSSPVLAPAPRPGKVLAPPFINKWVDFGAGPRAGIYLANAGRAFAAMAGEPAVSESDIQKAAIPVLRHRIGTNFQAQAEGKSSEEVIRMLLAHVRPRDEGKYDRRAK